MEISKINSLIRFYFNMNPDVLSDDEWCKYWGQLQFAIRFDLQRTHVQNETQLNQMLGG